jgi:hypothetical protein
MGDGKFNRYVTREVGYAIYPSNGDKLANDHADFITERSDGVKISMESGFTVQIFYFSHSRFCLI